MALLRRQRQTRDTLHFIEIQNNVDGFVQDCARLSLALSHRCMLHQEIHWRIPSLEEWTKKRYCQISNIRHIKSQNLNGSCFILQLSLSNLLKPGGPSYCGLIGSMYHGCWCPGSLCYQVISSHDFGYVIWVSPGLSQGRISTNCVMSVWRNTIYCRYTFMFPVKNLAREGLSCPLSNRISYALGREYRVVINRYSRLLFTSEYRLCANLRVQEKSTNMTSQY